MGGALAHQNGIPWDPIGFDRHVGPRAARLRVSLSVSLIPSYGPRVRSAATWRPMSGQMARTTRPQSSGLGRKGHWFGPAKGAWIASCCFFP